MDAHVPFRANNGKVLLFDTTCSDYGYPVYAGDTIERSGRVATVVGVRDGNLWALFPDKDGAVIIAKHADHYNRLGWRRAIGPHGQPPSIPASSSFPSSPSTSTSSSFNPSSSWPSSSSSTSDFLSPSTSSSFSPSSSNAPSLISSSSPTSFLRLSPLTEGTNLSKPNSQTRNEGSTSLDITPANKKTDKDKDKDKDKKKEKKKKKLEKSEKTKKKKKKDETKKSGFGTQEEMYKAIICSLEHQVQELTNSTSLLQNKIDELGALNSLLQYQVEQLTGEMRVLKLRNENLVGRDLSNLNTSQLEELETIHHDGLRCISTEKLRRLESEMEAQKNKFQEMQEQFLCLVCCDQQSVVVLLPCAHQCLCDGCAAKLDLCPVCRATIEQRITTYRS